MVGPSITAEEREIANRRLKYGFVLLIAASAVLMSLQIDPTIEQVAAVFVGGLIFGTVLLWFVLRNLEKFYYRL